MVDDARAERGNGVKRCIPAAKRRRGIEMWSGLGDGTYKNFATAKYAAAANSNEATDNKP